MYAICVPSGDQRGDWSDPSPAASLRGAPPATSITHRSLRLPSSAFGVGFDVYASRVPSGDHCGSLATSSPVGSIRALCVATSSTQRRANL